jgi:hypothetical protein
VAYYVIESTDGAALAAYRDSLSFRTDFLDGKPAESFKACTCRPSSMTERGVGPVHWLLVEDDTPEDNATFRLDARGQLRFLATGVVV